MIGARSADLKAALAALRAGEAVAIPTETVYGLAADAENPAAVRRVFALKGRPADHPLIVHLGEAAWLERYVCGIPEAAWRLAERFWPGPLTLVLPRHPRIPAVVTGGQDTVALRVPDHPLTLSLLRAFGRGLVAPSANRFGGISPTAAAHVREEFGERVAVILDGGPCTVGIESTILDLSGEPPAILRPGAITAEALAAVLGQPPATGGTGRPRVPGSLARHYAPRTPLRLAPRPELEAAPPGTLLLAIGRLPPGRRGLALPAAPEAYARGLYAALRALDREGAALILVERPPEDPAWSAIRDRLRRAAG